MTLPALVRHENDAPKERSTELDYVLEGQGTVTLDGVEHAVRPGSIVHIPPGRDARGWLE